MELQPYLSRIDYRGITEATLTVLSGLQLAHLLHIPFENLDIHNKIKLDLDKSYEKVVMQKRGGFCYELNSIFFQLLKTIGFNVKMVSARVFSDKKTYGAEFDHMAIIAKIEDADYLVDVGFGEFAFHPLKIELNREQGDPRGKFMIIEGDENYLIVMKKNAEGEFIPEYKFSMIERKLQDFLGMCEYHQTNPMSHFTQKRICSLATMDGRITISDYNFKTTSNGQVEERILADEAEVFIVLKKYFNIVLTEQKRESIVDSL
jgi:N-hydroxyarylamine O-acetyltransferase